MTKTKETGFSEMGRVEDYKRDVEKFLLEVFRMSAHFRQNGGFDKGIQVDVNRLILLERVQQPKLGEKDWLKLTKCAQVMAKNPDVASILADGFALSMRNSVIGGKNA